jgi:glutathione S-transferase
MLRLYDDPISGNGDKVRLLLGRLGRDYEYVPVDVTKGATRRPSFLALNPNGRIPLLRLDDGSHLAESNAILVYLAEGTRFWPADRLGRAQALQWMFFEQYSHEPAIAVARYWRHLPEMDETQARRLPELDARGHAALGVMEGHLASRDFFVDAGFGVADIALYAYTHVADEGGFDLAGYPNVRAWLDRVAAQPGHVAMTAPAPRHATVAA